MPLFGILLSHYWKPMILAVMVAAVVAYREVLVHQRDSARGQIVQLTAEATSLRTSNQALGQMIARQNAAVAELKARADVAVNAMSANETAATREGSAAQGQAMQQAHALMETPMAAGSGCEGAIRWGNARAAELSSW